ncbi:MAG: hypothetical protein GXP41_09410 [Chloroflexi bacterium]|nr:hypothetical protein [Chloroflexota bacterium]
MTVRRTLAGLFLISLLVRLLTALPLRQPGYFDAYSYVNVARNLLHGQGLVENVIWNFLDNPAGIPRPSHLYWMPLSTFLAYAGMRLFGDSYRASQTFFVLLSSLLPPLSAWIAYRVWRNIRYAWIAGLLTLFSGFYFIYWVTPENWTPFALAVDISLLTLYAGLHTGRGRYFAAAGLAAGFAHLARADGILLLPVALLVIAAQPKTRNPKSKIQNLKSATILLGFYFVVMTPWFYRNWLVVGTPLPSAGTKTIFLRSYEDFFSYGLDLTWGSYLAWGIGPIVRSKLDAGLWNLIILAGALQFFLAPFAVIGWWRNRRHPLWRPFFLYGAALFAAMVLVFTFPSRRGSMLHSAAALIPFACAAVPGGIESAVAFIARRRHSWDAGEAQRFFGWGFVGLSVLISLFLYAQAIHKPWLGESLLPPWNQRSLVYQDVNAWLRTHDRAAGRLMVVDPPALHYFTGREAVVIPNNSVEAIRRAAQRYDVAYLVLEHDHVVPLNSLYQDPQSLAGFELRARFQDAKEQPVYLFRLKGVEH